MYKFSNTEDNHVYKFLNYKSSIHKIKKLHKKKEHMLHHNGKQLVVQKEQLMDKQLLEIIQMNSILEQDNVMIKMHGGKLI